MLVINSFSTQTSYENQTKKAITNTFIAEALTDFLKHSVWRSISPSIPPSADEICCRQVLVKQAQPASRPNRRAVDIKKKLTILR